MSGVFNTVGRSDHPYMILPESDVNYVASYLRWWTSRMHPSFGPCPSTPGTVRFYSDSFEGEAAIVVNSRGKPVLAMATRYNGAYFLSDGPDDAVLSSTGLSFGDQSVGTTGAAQTVTLTNTASATLNVSSVHASGDFRETDNCTAPLAPGTSCSITVSFRPTNIGPRGGNITISSNAAGSPQTVSLSGVGITGAPGVALSASVCDSPVKSSAPPAPLRW